MGVARFPAWHLGRSTSLTLACFTGGVSGPVGRMSAAGCALSASGTGVVMDQ
jgi:hypothetical protein